MPVESPVLTVRSEDAFLHDQAQSTRAGVYELLGRLMVREPDEELLQVLRDIGEVDASEGQVAMGWELMKQASRKTTQADVKVEYFDLFVGVGRGELVPYGSWYLTGFLMEKPLALLRSDLADLGIERQGGVRESEDHIAGLCDAMAIIIRSHDDIPLATQQAFFNGHLAPWAGRFFNDLQNAQAAHFYRSVGFFGESFFNFEQRLLSMRS